MERNLRLEQPTIYFISPKSLIYSRRMERRQKMFVDSLNRRTEESSDIPSLSLEIYEKNLHPETSRRKKDDGSKGAAYERR